MTSKTKTDPAAATDRAGPNPVTEPRPSIGRIVHYSITDAQAAYADAQAGRKNVLKAEKTCPAIVTDVHGDDCVDLRILIGGQDAFVTSAMKGRGPGMWRWPERV